MVLARCIGLVLVLILLVPLTKIEARTVAKSVSVKDTEKTTLSELDRFLDEAQEAINDNAIRSLCWYLNGNIGAGASQGHTYSNIPFDFLPLKIRLHVDTAPASQSLIIDINDDGTSIFNTRAEIDAGATEQDGNEEYTQSEIEDGSDVSLDIDQVGSGTTGADLTVCLYGRT